MITPVDDIGQPDRALAAVAGDVHGSAEHRRSPDFCSERLGILMLFNLITLPVEFDASARARVVLRETGLIRTAEEDTAVAQVLPAAVWTYVAAFITSLTYFLFALVASPRRTPGVTNHHGNIQRKEARTYETQIKIN